MEINYSIIRKRPDKDSSSMATISMLATETGVNEHTVRSRIRRAKATGVLKDTDFIRIGNMVFIRREAGLSIAGGNIKLGRPFRQKK